VRDGSTSAQPAHRDRVIFDVEWRTRAKPLAETATSPQDQDLEEMKATGRIGGADAGAVKDSLCVHSLVWLWRAAKLESRHGVKDTSPIPLYQQHQRAPPPPPHPTPNPPPKKQERETLVWWDPNPRLISFPTLRHTLHQILLIRCEEQFASSTRNVYLGVVMDRDPNSSSQNSRALNKF
jgi:hypothetical protein